MNPLVSALAQWAEALANGGLALDPDARRRLARLEGRSIQLESTWGTPVTVEFSGERIRVMARTLEQPDAIVRGTPAALVGAALGAPAAELRIDGDEVLIDAFLGLLKGVRPDLSGPLAGLIGDEAADMLVGFLELGSRAAERLGRILVEDGTRAAGAAARRGFLDRASLDRFADEIIETQLAMDRAVARVARLEAAEGAPP